MVLIFEKRRIERKCAGLPHGMMLPTITCLFGNDRKLSDHRHQFGSIQETKSGSNKSESMTKFSSQG
ncbi:hypothetical protein N665_3284s0001 [Sinapis alba]|nr:hypothetical protein N665_3284s0001 [Sinapis alba]